MLYLAVNQANSKYRDKVNVKNKNALSPVF